MMKAVFILLVCATMAFAQNGDSCEYNHGNGQPGCSTQEEVSLAFWRNNWDPTAYWKCETLGTAATAHRCNTGTMFDSATLTCIDWADWVWSFPCDPPSSP